MEVCELCKMQSDFTIKNKKICVKCFKNKFIAKARRELNKITSNIILASLNENIGSVIVFYILQQIYNYRKNQTLIIICPKKIATIFESKTKNYTKFFLKCFVLLVINNKEPNNDSKIDAIFNKVNIFNVGKSIVNNKDEKNMESIFILKFITQLVQIELNIPVVIVSDSLLDIAVKTLKYIVNGNGLESKKYVETMMTSTQVITPLNRFTYCEIEIFYSLIKKEIGFEFVEGKKHVFGIEKILRNFLKEREEENYSCLYNVIEILKKL